MESLERLGGEDLGQRSPIGTVAGASLIGTTIEFYDFFIFGTAAALIFPALFFTEATPFVGTLLAFATFGVGFVARPLGGVVFGHYGDKLGRKTMLVLSLLIMGLATVLVGALPTFAQVGVLAPILLVTLRLLQGIAVGGEWGGAVLMAVEHAPPGRRGFYGSWPQSGGPLGIVLANVIFFSVSLLPEDAFLAWGWRVPFLLSAVLVGIGLFIRLKITESPTFQRIKGTHTEARMPIVDVFHTYPKQVFLAAGTFTVLSAVIYVFVVYMSTYATNVVGVSTTEILGIISISSTLCFFAHLFFGALSDRTGRKPLFLIGVIGLGASTFPSFWLINTGNFYLMLVGHVVVFALFLSVAAGTVPALFSEMFGTRVRYTGISLGYQVANILGGALAPIIATSLVEATGSAYSISAYLVVLAVISLVCMLLISETYQSDIEEDRPEERGLLGGTAAERSPG
jgi:MHS family shikimate/dehydroshikimate transporter-like MFS transporter